jgi:uncharacterized protein (TIGR02099 family)
MSEPQRDSAPTNLAAVIAKSPSPAVPRRFSLRAWSLCVRTFFWLTVALVVLFVGAIAATRFWLVPNADQFRPRVVEELSKLTKQRVAIGSFSADWNGWSPEFRVSRLQILDPRGRVLLELPEIETRLSWRSLFAFEPRLSSLTVREPRVVVRRTSENQLTVAGIDVDLSDTSPGDPAILEWLLRQRYVQIAGGEFEWQDEWRKLPPLRLRDVNIRLANDGAYHRMGMRATPASEIASPIEFRTEFVGTRLRRVNEWDGNAYVRVDYANVGVLSRYLPLPIDIARGEGGIQAWFDVVDGRATAVTTDLVVRDARMTLQPTAQFQAQRAEAAPKSQTPSPSTTVDGKTVPPPIAFNALTGRFSWRETIKSKKVVDGSEMIDSSERWSLRDVAVTALNGEKLPPLSAELTLDRANAQLRGGEFRAAKIDLASANSLANVVAPLLPPQLIEHARASAPRGTLSDAVASWKVAADAQLSFDVSAQASALAWSRGVLPGASGLNGRLRATDQGGSFTFATSEKSARDVAQAAKQAVAKVGGVLAKKEAGKPELAVAKPTEPLVLDFGDRFEEPLLVGSANGSLQWKRLAAADTTRTPAKLAQWQVSSDGIDVQNEWLKMRFAGSWRSDDLGPGIAKISGKIDFLEGNAVHRYMPNTIADARRWVKGAITAGRANNATFSVEGPLWHFPFVDDKQGKLEIVAPVAGVTVDYADQWPRAENVEAVLSFRGNSFNANVSKATMAAATLSATQVKIADMGHAAVVDIRGSAASSLENFLRFVETSPVNRMIDRFTEGSKATGNAKLSLALSIPVADVEKTKVDGEVLFEGNRIDLPGDVPPLDAVTGRLSFSERGMSTKEIRATALGGATTINVATEQGTIKAEASGRAEMARLRENFDYPLLDQLVGAVDWKMEMQAPVARDATVPPVIKIAGTLAPQTLPFDRVYQAASTPRDATKPIAFTLVRNALAQGRDRIEFEVPSQLHAILERSAETVAAPRVVERAVIDFGAQKTALPARGYSLRGEIAKLDTDAALALLPAISGKNAKNVGGVKVESSAPDFVNVNLKVDRAIVFSHMLTDVSLRAQPSGLRWRLALRSKEASGVIAVDNEGESGNVEAVSVRLQRFAWPLPATEADGLATNTNNATSNNAAASGATDPRARWPKLDLIAESFVSDGRELGRLEIKAQPRSDEWQIESVKLTSADGSLSAKGRWKLPSRAPAANSTLAANGQTSVEVALNWKDAGRFMQRFGLPKGVERGEGELNGELEWTGSPAQFAYSKLGGKFALKTGGGRFTEMEPGIAKLLGVISLQSLPRRLSFNFDDLFGRGFAFDSIDAEVAIASGKASTDGFAIVGPAARVEIRGVADLDAETSALRVRVFPSLSVAAAIGIGLATANPAIGAAAWLGQKIARDPVERILMQEFEVAGPWANPEVKQTRGMNVGANTREETTEDGSTDSTRSAVKRN